MRCERVQELLSDYCEGTLQEAMKVPLESHLQDCPSCKEEAVQLNEVWAMLGSAPVVEPPDHFRTLVWARIETEAEVVATPVKQLKPAFNWRSLFSRPAIAWSIAALFIVVLAGVVVPGRYSGAKMMFPWSLFSHSAKAELVTVGTVRVEEQNGTQFLIVPMTPKKQDAFSVEIAGEGGSAQWVMGTNLVDFKDGTSVEVPLRLSQDVSGKTLVLKVQSNGTEQMVTVTVP